MTNELLKANLKGWPAFSKVVFVSEPMRGLAGPEGQGDEDLGAELCPLPSQGQQVEEGWLCTGSQPWPDSLSGSSRATLLLQAHRGGWAERQGLALRDPLIFMAQRAPSSQEGRTPWSCL